MMGVESAVYRVIPADGTSEQQVSALLDAGAERRGESRLVLRGRRYWIDSEVGVPAPSIGLRVSFSNPVDVVPEIRRVFGVIASAGSGDVVDPTAKRRFSVDDAAKVEQLLADYVRRRELFQRHFGPFEVAVSAGDVFRLMRERSAERP
ncbi:hypothetical protein WBG06_04735 [Nocardioides sp. CCNWLW239]|uniref:hypothetical protein n=1 Tax=Nocardioides sp. CCNWLW239 TaxID=3128902 RepID=UPI0030199557